MQRRNLHSRIVARLQRLPALHAAHYGVVPLPPGDALPVSIVGIEDDFLASTAAIARIDALAAGWPEIGAVQRLMSRLEAVQSSRIEGKTGTFEQLVTHEATQAAEAEDATSAESSAIRYSASNGWRARSGSASPRPMAPSGSLSTPACCAS